ncbi:MAG: FAD-dependent oxidoreductase [Chlamydiales bacterium]|nr:FAD-dependent oxidoreductase [Chlamydiales bacterium]
MVNKKIAIIGAGFAGLASAYYASSNADVTVIESEAVGAGASGVSAGLLHCYVGKHAKLNWRGREAVAASKELITVVEEATGRTVSQKNGFLRIAIDEVYEADFQKSAEIHKDVEWLTAADCRDRVPGLVDAPGIFVTSGWTVDAAAYMSALWELCESRGVRFRKEEIDTLAQLSSYDHVVVAAGARTRSIRELSALPLRQMKGQLLRYPWPEELPPLTYPVSGQVYVVMTDDGKACWVGSTFEKNFADVLPDQDIAYARIHLRLTDLFPCMEKYRPTDCQAGVRCTSPNHLPLVDQFNERTTIFTGLGSKGLLYHALFAKQIVQKINHKSHLQN